MIPTLIDKFDTFEIVRDKIAEILVKEVASQKAKAVTAGEDPALWDLKVYTERSNPWEAFLNQQADQVPLVNVWYDNSTFPQGSSNISERQTSETVYNIDCYGFGKSENVIAGGHIPGDLAAALNLQRAIRLVRNILMAAEYTYLEMRGVVGQRWPQSVTSFQPSLSSNSAQQVVAARIAFRVKFNEFSPQVSENVLELVSMSIIRAEDGEIVLQADYSYPL